MTFPTNSTVIDAFTRSNGGVGANWSLYYGDFGTLNISSNQIVGETNGNYLGSYYNVSNFGPDSECYIDVPTPGTAKHVSLTVRGAGTLASTPNGYMILVVLSTGSWSIIRIDTGTQTVLGATFTQVVSAGDSIGISAVGSTITAYYKASGGSWSSLTTRSDSTYSAAGKHAVEIEHITTFLDNFSGGTVVAGGGSTTNKTLSATVTFTPTIQKQVNKTLAQTVTFTPSVVKLVSKTLAKTVTFTASVTALKVLVRTLSATVTFTGSVQKQVSKALSQTVTFTPSLGARTVSKALSQTVTFTPSVVKSVAKTLAKTVTFTASVATQKAFTKTLSATVTFTAAVQKQVQKNLAQTVTFTPSVTKLISKTLAQTVTFTPSVVKTITKTLGQTVSFTASMVKTFIPFVGTPLPVTVKAFSVRVARYVARGQVVEKYIASGKWIIKYLGRGERNR